MCAGSWNLNPWFVRVEQGPMTEIPIGRVGVVISYVGKAHEDVSGETFLSFFHGSMPICPQRSASHRALEAIAPTVGVMMPPRGWRRLISSSDNCWPRSCCSRPCRPRPEP